jgi:hypothetical protein
VIDRQLSSLLLFFASTSINPVLHSLGPSHNFLWLRLSHKKFLLTQIQVTPPLNFTCFLFCALHGSCF